MASLRDELAAVLGPGNNDLVAYEQADAVLGVLLTQVTDLAIVLRTPWCEITADQTTLFEHPLMSVAGKSINVRSTFEALENWLRS